LSTFDPALEKAVLYAVGNTLVCDVLEEAKSLAWGQERFKGDALSVILLFTVYGKSILIWLFFLLNAVVTLDGILLSKSGTMTGGISGGMEARSQKWDDRAIEGIF
jgi:structural maintenance of chromosome 1